MSRYSNRLRHELEENSLWQELTRRRIAREEIIDLTESNPTRVGIELPGPEVLKSLARPEALTYRPEPMGLLSAREAVAEYYASRGCAVAPDDVLLTASTSEAYAFLFKLLCDPGDEVLVPRPSYPLFDILASLECVSATGFPVATGPIEPLGDRCRAIITVHPNNPTGDYVPEERRARLQSLSGESGPAIIVDEVFLDYDLTGTANPRSFADAGAGLVLVLSGLSKLAALPQLKLSWIVVAGEPKARRDALRRLEHIADAFLSVGTPVQLAAPRLLELAPRVRQTIQERTASNLATLRDASAHAPSVTLHPPEGGWYATLRLPEIESSEAWALRFLREAAVYVHPGSFFGFPHGAHAIVSLLPPPARFRRGIEGVLDVLANRIDSRV